MVIRYVKV